MIFLDYNSTTPIDPKVLEAMMPYLALEWGNPSSTYRFGAKLKGAVETAREQVAKLIGAQCCEVLFTSCATESNNTAINAALMASGKRHVITCMAEHSSVLNYCKVLEKKGYVVTYLPINRDGLLNVSDLENAITDDSAVVSLMWANNETGVIFPVNKIGEVCRARGVLFHCDAVQAVGKMPVNVDSSPFDYLSISGHKFGAPKGIGALYVRQNAPFVPFVFGGHQEDSRRGGTENVPYIVGLGIAAENAIQITKIYSRTVQPMRDTLEHGILATIPHTEINGHPSQRIANTTNIRIQGVDNDAVLVFLDQAGICASSGSACMESAITPSHVITAMTGSHRHASESLRFSLGITNTHAEVLEVIQKVREFVEMVR